MIRVGLLGRGMAGSIFHAPLIRAVPDMELVAIAGSADAASVIADPDIELVVVATPNQSHFPLAQAALKAGKHVVVDKPLVLTSAEADALIALADEKQRLLTVFHNRRWDGDFLTVRETVESGRLGEIALYQAHWDRFRPSIKAGWRELAGPGAGLLFDLGPHLVDQALQLFGTPQAVTADLATQRKEAMVDDYFHLMLDYGRLRVILSAATLVAAPRPRFALYGTGGALVKYGLDPQETALRAGADPLEEGFGEEHAAFAATLTSADGQTERVLSRAGRYLRFYEEVANAVLRGAAPPVDAADARLGLAIIERAWESARKGRTVTL